MIEKEIVSNIPLVGADGELVGKAKEEAVKIEQEEMGVPFQDFDIYQMMAEQFNVTPKENRLAEVMFGLAEEQGEFFGYHKRMARGDYETPEQQQEALLMATKELGDMLWYMQAWCSIHGIKFGEIPFNNINKLSKRKEQNLIKGSGDSRGEEPEIVQIEEISNDTK
jgi:NTP pyrophosphatase (non-canonical NTP hydrolase)